ncbi:hypothetical protein [Microbacterium sp. Marseille-Q6965]|uniref:hypothetical protein n=1 Tax=Microbacterium sp. Marseille-Q6965 TaxID=2965072 RepID=UPI0021B81C31|nr:hypothetical protein [Microbacterium sp. Marseille-Q6965]
MSIRPHRRDDARPRAARRAAPLLAGLAVLAFALTACGQSAPPDPEPAQTSPAPTDEQPQGGEPQAGSGDETPIPELTCETIIPAEVVAQFKDVGWTAEPEDFRIGSTVLPDGIQCVWGDYSVATDHVQIFGWAPVDSATASTVQDELETQGWIREEEDGIVYLTEDPTYAIATDDDGYGMTYAFGDGWVTLADTKQSLLLVGWPPAE